MSDVLSALGLPTDTGQPVEATPVTPEPEAPVVIPEAPEPEVVIPPGADNPDAVKRLIQEERQAGREARARARELESQLLAYQEAQLPAEDRIKAADKRAAEAESKALRLTVGLKHNIPFDLADRLRGTTEAELENDAKSFLAHLARPATPGADGGFQTPPPAAVIEPERAHDNFLLGIMGRAPGA